MTLSDLRPERRRALIADISETDGRLGALRIEREHRAWMREA